MNKIIVLFSIILVGINSECAFADLLKDQVFDSDGSQRTYDLYLPVKYPEKLSPLVLLLHGHRGDADVMTGENNKAAPVSYTHLTLPTTPYV